MPMKPNEREYRDFTLAVVENENNDTEERKMVNGYASVFDTPYTLYDGIDVVIQEQVDSRAFDEADLSDVIFQYNHEGRVFARTSNNTLAIIPDERGLAIEADLGGTEIGNQLYQEIKGGYTTKMSYGYTVRDAEWTDSKMEDGRTLELRTIKAVGKVYDVSAVSIPANDATTISVRNLSDGVIAEIEAERLKALELERRKLQTKLRLGGFTNV
ncbi:MAG: HK97 family phage prohead protease [Lachnospiraceae bacterium]|mgnify:CR=1 FL=1|nr:HK97 family phage prohead protease [Lachnospiraceae bacterium]